jgi:hypothetical protein
MSDPEQVIAEADEQLEQQKDARESAATQIVKLALAEGAELFHSVEGEAFATVPIDGRTETWPLKTKTVRRWLSRLFYLATEQAPGAQAIQDALGVLEGRALFDGLEHPVHVRVAAHDDKVYLDLADAAWHAVEIDEHGWRVVSDPPVKFKRARGMLPLPTPQAGGTVGPLRQFVNYASERDFRLMVAWLAMAYRPAGPYPVLALHGEQGSGKSTAAEVLRKLIDPNEALLRPPPRDERDLVIAGSNGRIVALENLSSVPQWLSDALCRISTGSGFATRELYSDADETIFSVQLPIVLNGIVEVVISGDLQDRSVVLTLPRIEEYCSEDDLWDAFELAQPKLLGALLDVVSYALATEQSVEVDGSARMADFARFAAAAAPALGWDPDELLDAYTENRTQANEVTLDASPLVAPLRKLGGFEGTATELLEELVAIVGDVAARSRVWPKSPSALSGALRRLAPNLRRGVPPLDVEFGRDANQRVIRVTRLEWVPETPSSPSHTAANDADDANDGNLRTDSNGDDPAAVPEGLT